MEFIIVTGLSGAGKSRAITALEDIGFYCVDNMPPKLLPKFAELCVQSEDRLSRVAMVVDVRGGQMFDDLFDGLQELRRMGIDYKILFLECDDQVLARRYKETRRQHPLIGEGVGTVYQAIGIECNKELEVLRDSLEELIGLLNPGGRLCIITFHSLEDRIVKSAFKKAENPCTCPPSFPVCVCGKVSQGKVITNKPILPGEEELERNSRAKSAKLRIFERA